jgi:hypothetical protein
LAAFHIYFITQVRSKFSAVGGLLFVLLRAVDGRAKDYNIIDFTANGDGKTPRCQQDANMTFKNAIRF